MEYNWLRYPDDSGNSGKRIETVFNEVTLDGTDYDLYQYVVALGDPITGEVLSTTPLADLAQGNALNVAPLGENRIIELLQSLIALNARQVFLLEQHMGAGESTSGIELKDIS